MPTGIYSHKKTQGFQKGNKLAKLRTKFPDFKGEKHPMFGRTGDKNPFYGHHHKEKSKQKISKANSGENNGKWTGEDASPRAIHKRLNKKIGKAKNYKCVDCDKQAEDWSNNKNHIYTENPEDYSPRCKSCHKKYDKKINKL